MSAAKIPQFERLAAIATLGTRRAPLPKESPWPDDSLAPAGAEPASRETCLLRAAAAGAVWERAGARAASSPAALPRDFPARVVQELDESAGWRLARIVGGEHSYLLDEWFEAAAATGRALPPHWLPMVLDHVAPDARAAFATVLGPAATWLAGRNPRWLVAPAEAELADARWQEGSLEERQLLLAAIRKCDRPRSQAWLRSTWEADAPEAREAFLGLLAADVAADDEPFLEAALDDKRKPVRQAAANALARLPESAHATYARAPRSADGARGRTWRDVRQAAQAQVARRVADRARQGRVARRHRSQAAGQPQDRRARLLALANDRHGAAGALVPAIRLRRTDIHRCGARDRPCVRTLERADRGHRASPAGRVVAGAARAHGRPPLRK